MLVFNSCLYWVSTKVQDKISILKKNYHHYYILFHDYKYFSYRSIIFSIISPYLIYLFCSIYMCALFSYFHWLTMVAILQLKASKHFVYFVSIAVVTFTLLSNILSLWKYLIKNLVNQHESAFMVQFVKYGKRLIIK